MDAADEMDEDELLDYDVQMSIQESCQQERLTGSGRYGNMKQLPDHNDPSISRQQHHDNPGICLSNYSKSKKVKILNLSFLNVNIL